MKNKLTWLHSVTLLFLTSLFVNAQITYNFYNQSSCGLTAGSSYYNNSGPAGAYTGNNLGGFSFNGGGTSIASGQTRSVTVNPGAFPIYFRYTFSDGGRLAYDTGLMGPTTSQPISYNVTISDSFCTNLPPCTTNLTYSIKNSDIVTHSYVATYSTTMTSTYYQLLGDVEVAPGKTGTLILQGLACTNAPYVIIVTFNGGTSGGSQNPQGGTDYYIEGQPGPQVAANPVGTAGGTPPASSATPVDAGTSTPPQYNATNNAYSGTNSPIIFSGTNTATSTLEGLSAIYTAINAQGALAHQDNADQLTQIKNIYNGVTGIYTNAQAVSIAERLWASNSVALAGMNNAQYLSNVLKGGINVTGIVASINGTNGFNTTNLATVTFQAAMSNLLQQQLDFITNNAPISKQDTTNGFVDGLITNRYAAGMALIASGTNAGASAMSGGFSGLKTGGLFPEHAVEDTSAGGIDFDVVALNGAVSLHFGTTAIDTAFPIMANARPIATWTIYLLLAIMNYLVMIKILRNTVLVPQARTTGQSIMGNNLSLPSAIAMATTIIAVASAIPVFASSYILGAFAHVFWGNPVQGVASIGNAYQFCEHYFPINLMVSALLGHLGFRFAANSLEGVGYGIIKFAVGV